MDHSDTKQISARGFDPSMDGIDHINIHPSRHVAATVLGQDLSNFKHKPFIHPYYGNFCSIEGLYYYLRNIERDDSLRHLSHDRAYRQGRKGTHDPYPEFRDDILGAIYQKILQNKVMRKSFVTSTLPFDMYYQYGAGKVIISPRDSDWMIDGITEIRASLQRDEIPDVWYRAEERYLRGELRHRNLN